MRQDVRHYPMLRDVQVMMLAAGFGTRLWPLTHNRAKPAIPFLGRPLIRGMVDWLTDHGARDLVVNTHYCPHSIHNALQDIPEEVRVTFSHEPAILGTAGCLAQALHHGWLKPDRTTLVVNAKLFTTLDLSRALQVHRQRRANITMVLRSNRQREAFTTVHHHEDGQVIGFGPSRVPVGDQPKLFTGIHLLEPATLKRAELKFSDSISDLYPAELRAGRVWSYVDDAGHWLEASTLERYLELQLELLDGQIHRADTAKVDKHAQIERTFIGNHVQIGQARVKNAILLDGAIIEDGAIVNHAVVGERGHVPKNTNITGAVVVPSLYGAYPDKLTHELSELNNMTIVSLKQSAGNVGYRP